MTQRTKTILAAAAGVCVLALVGTALAYFAADDTVPNLVEVGEDVIEVTEIFTPPNQENEFIYRKTVQIQNTGTVPCYVRVRLEMSDSKVQDVASFSAANPGPDDQPPDESTFKSARIPDNTTDTAYYVNGLPEGWVYVWEANADAFDPPVTQGYYYYETPVQPGKSTDALISWIRMQYGDTADIQAHDVFVYAESVQTVDANTSVPYADWKAAWSSFASP